ncbi:Hsp20/alpha crystallin family protein [Streptomyces sp.]|uniref:Hsp20/alpha crystallin family protein n=1 Tax=Streptomyces sp. TaxID=1931 RepID=UPI002D30A074|nr:Hsp20/alpha crystallin family protein [Streptomyces sp.]HZF88203.1 Hsp20/alpha crystallin family protein [Streptomyces sp.]
MNTPARRGGGPLEPRRGPGRGGPWDRDPLAELRRLWRDTDGAVDRGTPARDFGRGSSGWGGGFAWVPAVEEDETDEAYEIRAGLPGIPRERITVDIDERELRISGDSGDPGEERRARPVPGRGGRFFHRTCLPTGADPDRAEADLTDGILRIRLPKSAAPERRRLPIGGADRETITETHAQSDRGTNPETYRTGADT